MRKILSLFLILILFLGIFVSCDNNEQSESSSESTQESEEMSKADESSSETAYNKTKTVEYYYRRSYLERDSVRHERGVTLIESEDELKDFFAPKGINAFESENIEKMLSKNYILVITRDPLPYNGKIMGYRDIEIINNEGIILLDILETYDDIEYKDGDLIYIEFVPAYSNDSNEAIYSTYYDIILVPRDKATINNNNISVTKLIHQIL